MAVVRELVTKLSFSADTNKVKAFASGINSLKKSMMVATGTAAALATGLFLLIKRTANYGDQLGETADKLNVSTEYLQAFGYAADLAGIKSEQFAGTLKIFGQRLAQAQAGNEGLKESFNTLGISVTDSNGKVKSTELVFTETLSALSKIEDVNKRNALAFDVLGRSGTATANLLAGNFDKLLTNVKSFADKGNIIPKSEIAKIEKLQDSFDILSNTFNILLTQILARYAPEIERIIKAMEEFIVKNRELIMTGLKDFLLDVFKAGKIVWGIIKDLSGAFEWLSDAVGGSEKAVKYLLALFVGAKFGPWGLAIAGIGIAITEVYTQANDASTPLGAFIESLDATGAAADKAKEKYGALYLVIKALAYQYQLLNKYVLDPVIKKYALRNPEIQLSGSAKEKLSGYVENGYNETDQSKRDSFAWADITRPNNQSSYVNQSTISPTININVTNPPTDAESWASEAGLIIRNELTKQLVQDNNEFPKYY